MLSQITIEDKYNLSKEELHSLALDIAHEKAIVNGWQISSVERTDMAPVQKGEYTRYEFNLYGEVENKRIDVSTDENKDITSQPIAASQIDIGI